MKLSKYLIELVISFKHYLRLDEWKGEISIVKEKRADKTDTYMDIHINQDYLDFNITVYPGVVESYKQKDYAQIVEAIVHELSHIITEPLYLMGIEGITNQQVKTLEMERERATERIARIIIRQVKYNNYTPDGLQHRSRPNKRNKKNRRKSRPDTKSNGGIPSGKKQS